MFHRSNDHLPKKFFDSNIMSIHRNMGPDIPQEYTFIQLKNMGSTCFINAILQSLFSTSSVANFCWQFTTLLEKFEFMSDACSTDPLFFFVKIYIDSQRAPQNEVYYEPNYFLDSIYTEDSPFKRYRQEDSSEFLLFILHSFDKTVQKVNDIIPEDCALPLFSSLFTGNSFTYEINDESNSYEERFSFIPIACNDIKEEIIQWEKGTDISELNHGIELKRKITEFPPLLWINIKLFIGNKQKIIQPIIPYKTITISNTNYFLKAIVLHIGDNIDDGHYICFFEIKLRWVYADDDCLRPLNDQEYHDFFEKGILPWQHPAMPYLLLYEKE